jgi:LTXXQ motif family protein
MFVPKKLVMIGLPLLVSGLISVGPAFAQATRTDRNDPPAASAPTERADQSRHHRHDLAAHVQKRLDKLKATLGIMPEQEPQWAAFTDAVMAQVKQIQAEHQSVKVRRATAPERIDWRLARMKERTARFEVVAQAAKDLYASLTPEQKQIADKKLLNFHHGYRA